MNLVVLDGCTARQQNDLIYVLLATKYSQKIVLAFGLAAKLFFTNWAFQEFGKHNLVKFP
jgi:hypothetical protein